MSSINPKADVVPVFFRKLICHFLVFLGCMRRVFVGFPDIVGSISNELLIVHLVINASSALTECC